MAIRIPWDKYEAALLLVYCIKVENKELTRKEAVSTVSQILRQRAISAGRKIDDVFRNENGISMQLSAIRNCYLGKEYGLTSSKLFYETVELSKNNPDAFQQILQKESDEMENTIWQEFLQQEREISHIDENPPKKQPFEEDYNVLLSGQKHSTTDKHLTPKWKPNYTKEITEIISVKYKYGFRIGSAIEMMKIRNYAEVMELELPESDEELEKELIAAGTSIDGKVYVFSETLLTELGNIIDEIFRRGSVVIFLRSFMEKHEEWAEENHIASDSLLKEVLKRCRPALYFGQNIITQGKRMTELEAVISEIHRIAGFEAVVRTSELFEQLIYIPSTKITWSLSASDEFVWISEGMYFRMSHFIYSEEDSENIVNFVSKECITKGYASITDVPMGSIPEENYELSITALYSAVYNAILKEQYYLKGKILTTDSNGVDITILLKDYCRERNECNVSEMMERAMELTGSTNKQYSLVALYDNLVRADIDRFVSEEQVSFDIEKIDNLLAELIGEGFAPIRKISTFSLFPICGLAWNLYVLESYCYRFSKKYRLSVLNYNDKNAGIIAAIDLPLAYNEMLSEAAAKADIELTPDAVGEYLFTNGFTAKRKYSSMPKIIEMAKKIREEK